MNGHRRITALLGTGLSLALALAATPPAAADDRERHGGRGHHDGSRTIAEGLTAPLLGLAVDRKGTVYVAQSFVGSITAIDRRGGASDVVTGNGTGVNGVAAGGHGSLYWLETGMDPAAPPVGVLKHRSKDGTVHTVADLAEYETTNNPDAGSSYGFQGLDPACKALFPPVDPTDPGAISPDPQPGDVNPNPYAVALGEGGSVYVADAGGNVILRVSKQGDVNVVAILPPVPFEVTPQVQGALGLPDCTVGATYNFQPVPTDVEVGPDGMLYVSSLPGGPEDDSLGYRGGVFRVNPWTGDVTRVGWGLLGAVDLAIDEAGRIYVAELFGNSITRVGPDGNKQVAALTAPGAVEYSDGRLYATTGNGFASFGQPVASVVTIRR